jgi:hypothetical protein
MPDSRSKLQAAIDELLREQSDQTNMIETLWALFAASVKIPPGGTQWVESRRCFFAGAATVFEAMMRIMEPGEEATDADVARVDRIAQELIRYQADLQAGRA